MERLRTAFPKYWPHAKPTLHFWAETEVHVYSFSVAANVLLSFFPFMIVLTSIIRYALNWFGVEQGIYIALRDYFAGETGEFIVRNLQASVYKNGSALSWVSIVLLLFTANGIFMPLEVAFNRIWGIHKNRSFISNQIISQGLIFVCGSLWLVASFASAPVAKIGWLSAIVYKLASYPITVGIVFLTYWLLPNAKIPPLLVALAAAVVALAIELLKLINLLIWPWLYTKLRHEYGPFVHAVTILTWSFLFSMLVLAGAEWSARKAKELGLDIKPRET
jgi:uncharacterized BrkB/YihY/UPF0761 family membrane protein